MPSAVGAAAAHSPRLAQYLPDCSVVVARLGRQGHAQTTQAPATECPRRTLLLTTCATGWMSFFFGLLPEPHDARVRSAALQTLAHHPSNATSTLPRSLAGAPAESRSPATIQDIKDSTNESRDFTSLRSLKQFSLFMAGASFFVFSSVITRRALVRKYHAVQPAGQFSPSNYVPEVNGGVEAAEALTLATLNVASLSMMLTGGALWAMDVSSLDDLRKKLRKGMHWHDEAKGPEESEKEIEAWMAVVMAHFQGKSDADVAEMVQQVADSGESGPIVK